MRVGGGGDAGAWGRYWHEGNAGRGPRGWWRMPWCRTSASATARAAAAGRETHAIRSISPRGHGYVLQHPARDKNGRFKTLPGTGVMQISKRIVA